MVKVEFMMLPVAGLSKQGTSLLTSNVVCERSTAGCCRKPCSGRQPPPFRAVLLMKVHVVTSPVVVGLHQGRGTYTLAPADNE